MVVMSMPSSKVNTLLQRFQTDYPDIIFKKDTYTFWDPKSRTISYNPNQDYLVWSLLHEIGHMRQGHLRYKLDVELLIMETEAWQTAKDLAKRYGIKIDTEYIEDCLDSYRDWLHKRSNCPRCRQTGAQTDQLLYLCLNCGQQWKVSISRFCRSYRMIMQQS